MHPARHDRGRRQRGIATVEFAIVLPVLMLLLLATAELGRMISQYNTLTKAVRDAARYAAAAAATDSTGLVQITPQLQSAVGNLVATGTIDGSGSPLLPGLSSAAVTVSNAGNGYVSVSVSYTYEPMLGVSLPMFGLGAAPALAMPLTAAAIMRVLG